jgi:DnaJ-class molecular chaperone
MAESFYNILGVTENSTKDEIKKAFRSLSMKHHPDKNPGNPDSTKIFQKITEAYETLGDEQKRQEYDMMNKNPFFKMGGPFGGGMGGGQFGGGGGMEVPIEEIFGAFFGGMPGMHPGSNVRMFRNGMPVNFNESLQKPSPIIKNITIEIGNVLTGITMPVEIERWIIEGGNKVFEKETIYVDIPKGVDDNEIIILREKGNVVNDTCKGDIKLFIKVENKTEFVRNGLDLTIEKSISLKDALCGFNFELKYINGKTYTLNNNTGNIISDRYKKTIPNMGLVREGHTGNLNIIFNIQFPTSLSEDKINKLREIL